jgi:DNA-binding transcriptional LysR family regulator
MDVRQLRYFVIAAEEENFHRAAERLHIAQPALSRQMAALEAAIGCVLFIRTKKRVHLAPAGRSVLEDARRILRDIELVADRARRVASGQTGSLHIGFHETAGRSKAVICAFGEFRSRFPDVELRLSQKPSPTQQVALRGDQQDAGFIYMSPEAASEFDCLPIETHHFYLALNSEHPLADRKRIRLRDLAAESLIWLARDLNPHYSNHLLREVLAGGLVPKVVQEAESEIMTLNLVAAGMGVAFAVSADPEAYRPGVIFRPISDLKAGMELALVWAKRSRSQMLDNFISVIRNRNDTKRPMVLSKTLRKRPVVVGRRPRSTVRD